MEKIGSPMSAFFLDSGTGRESAPEAWLEDNPEFGAPISRDTLNPAANAAHHDIDDPLPKPGTDRLSFASHPDAIILDLMMPEMDGFAVLEALRRKPRSCKVPVFIWTSMYLSEEEYARLATSARAIVDKGRTDLGSVVEQLHHWRLISSESA